MSTNKTTVVVLMLLAATFVAGESAAFGVPAECSQDEWNGTTCTARAAGCEAGVNVDPDLLATAWRSC